MTQKNVIAIRGAREHNLKNIDVDLPRNSLVVLTGVSGSGKSSLAFDTIYAEGQRRYVESLSAYARQFLEMMQKPDVDQIEGLSPAISIEQKTTSRNPRSTVGTVTEIYDYIRLLFARIGVPYSPATGLPIQSQTVSQMVDKILLLPEGTRLHLLAPIVRQRKGEYKKELAALEKQGFYRVKIDGVLYEIAQAPALDKKYKHDIDVLVDRIIVRKNLQTRLADSLETCLRLSNGLAIAEFVDKPLPKHEQANKQGNASKNQTHERIIFSENFSCPETGFTISEIEPRLFSFNNPFGACTACEGLGAQQNIDPGLIVFNPECTLAEGAIACWPTPLSPSKVQLLEELGKIYDFKLTDRWKTLSPDAQKAILYGTTKFISKKRFMPRRGFEGVIPRLERLWHEVTASHAFIEPFMASAPCKKCQGYRLKEEALAVKIQGLHIGQVCEMTINEAKIWFGDLEKGLSPKDQTIARRILKEIQQRLKFLEDVGLNYLTLARSSGTLSGGESQRIRLASQIGAGLMGVLYVLDEPSIGLHQRDNARLLDTLFHLRDLGNTVIVVEHDEDTICAADFVVDIGPGAGIHGGKIIAQGPPSAIIKNEHSLTGAYLSGKKKVFEKTQERRPDPKQMLKIYGASGNNLKNLSVHIPLRSFVCVTGVSGGGKSTLLIQTLFKAAARKLMGAKQRPAPYERIEGLEHLDKVIDIDQSPIGRTPRSNPATYIGVFTPIREWFAQLPEAKARGYKPGRFSFNVKGGRCEACQGDGVIKIEMHFLPDVYVTCDLCQGKRYNRETLEITFKGKSIADILDMTVEEGLSFFDSIPVIKNKLETLLKVGLGYIKIGQQATTLSGGEAQRVKLAKELSRKSTGSTLYILDEPTTGLHFHDISNLLCVLHTLVAQGNSVMLIEHNLDVIKTADWILDLGPEGGAQGGCIVAQGTPADVANEAASYTGQFLRKLLDREDKRPK